MSGLLRFAGRLAFAWAVELACEHVVPPPEASVTLGGVAYPVRLNFRSKKVDVARRIAEGSYSGWAVSRPRLDTVRFVGTDPEGHVEIRVRKGVA